MAFDISQISSRTKKPPRILLTGPDKVGKSTFAAESPAPFLIPVKGETGFDEIDVNPAPVSKRFRGDESVLEKLEWLATAEHEFKTIVIDSLTTLEPLVWADTCARYGVSNIEDVLKGYGKGYSQAAGVEWPELRDALDHLRDERGMGCILITHVKLFKFNDPMAAEPYDAYEISLQKDAAGLFAKWADCILFANTETFSNTVAKTGSGKSEKNIVHATGTGKRILYTEKRGSHPGGCRRSLPYKMEFTYKAFSEAYAVAKAGVPAK
jgi:hypothetical protein